VSMLLFDVLLLGSVAGRPRHDSVPRRRPVGGVPAGRETMIG
jgi:hypothetical protein